MATYDPELPDGEEELTGEVAKLVDQLSVDLGIEKTRTPLGRVWNDVRDHLVGLQVHGAASLTKKDVGSLGFDLYMDLPRLEDVVYKVLETRRDEIASPVVKPFAIVTIGAVKKLARDAKAKKIDLDKLQNDQTAKAYQHLRDLGVHQMDMENTLGSAKLTRGVRAESRILNEPVGIDKLLSRIERQVQEDGGIPLEELMARTVNIVMSQYNRHAATDIADLTQEEQIVYFLEGERLGRMRHLARTALLTNVEIIRLNGYED